VDGAVCIRDVESPEDDQHKSSRYMTLSGIESGLAVYSASRDV